MKSLSRIALVFVAVCLAGNVLAQDLSSQIAFTRAQTEADRQTIVAATLGLSEAEGEVFWQMYRDYRNEMAKADDRSWNLLVDFANKFESMTDADASTMLDEVLSIEKQKLDIKTKWMKKMRKSIPAATVARFYQIDNKLDTLIRLEVAGSVPLLEKAQ